MSEHRRGANALVQSDTATNAGSAVSVKKEEATEVAAANLARVSLTLSNDSANVIYVFKGPGAEVGEGIRLNAEGGVAVIDDYLGVVTASAKTGASNLGVCEV